MGSKSSGFLEENNSKLSEETEWVLVKGGSKRENHSKRDLFIFIFFGFPRAEAKHQGLPLHYVLLLRYDLTPTLLILMHDSFYYLTISLVYIDFLINCCICLTLFSRDLFLGT